MKGQSEILAFKLIRKEKINREEKELLVLIRPKRNFV